MGNRAREAAACSVLARSHCEIEENDIAQKMKVNKSWLQQIQKNFGRVVQLGPVTVRRPISAKPEVKFNPGFFFLFLKAFSRLIFSVIVKVFNNQLVKGLNPGVISKG